MKDRKYVYYSPAIDEMFTLASKPKRKTLPHVLYIGSVTIPLVYYIGEL